MLPGGPVAEAVFADLVPRIEKLRENGHPPGLATILVGEDEPSARYIAMKQAKAAELGFNPGHHVNLPAETTQAELIAAIREFNDAAAESGVALIVQPGGSVRDDEIIAAADEHGIAMVMTGERHFLH